MANVIKLKNSGVASNTPSAGNLEYGEIAINYNDGILFYKNPSNSVKSGKLITSIVGTTDQVTVSETSGAFTISLPSIVKIIDLYVNNIEIDPTGATSGQVLTFNGTKFAPATPSGGGGGGSSAGADLFLFTYYR